MLKRAAQQLIPPIPHDAGHGLTRPRRHELYLGLTDTDPDELRVSALPFDWIREIFLDSPTTNRVLILDCCYSGRAVADFMASSAEAILGQTEIAGTYTIASAADDALALAPPLPATPRTGGLTQFPFSSSWRLPCSSPPVSASCSSYARPASS